MKSIILILLASVVVSLFSGLFFLVKDRDSPDSTRMLTSLKIRVPRRLVPRRLDRLEGAAFNPRRSAQIVP
jgi:hypothetical protein